MLDEGLAHQNCPKKISIQDLPDSFIFGSEQNVLLTDPSCIDQGIEISPLPADRQQETKARGMEQIHTFETSATNPILPTSASTPEIDTS